MEPLFSVTTSMNEAALLALQRYHAALNRKPRLLITIWSLPVLALRIYITQGISYLDVGWILILAFWWCLTDCNQKSRAKKMMAQEMYDCVRSRFFDGWLEVECEERGEVTMRMRESLLHYGTFGERDGYFFLKKKHFNQYWVLDQQGMTQGEVAAFRQFLLERYAFSGKKPKI